MSVISISKEEFENFNMIRHSTFIATETNWYKGIGHKILGIILKDNIDKDWSYVILGLDEDKAYRAIDLGISYESFDVVEKTLYDSMNIIIKKGKSEEIIFKVDEKKISKDSKPIITDINDEIKKYLKKYPEKLYSLSPRKFEELIASIMVDLGFDVELTKATRDGGRDIIANIRNSITNFLIYVECKKYSPENKIGVNIIREISGVHYFDKPSKSIIITTSFFTKGAIEKAKEMENQLDLKDFYDIKNWLERY